ncbi:MAG: extracellular solute-binding protein [Acidimicrobiales bacterium]
MEYRVLGELQVLRDTHPVELGTFRQRALLALLLTAPNTVFSTDQLIDSLWGDDTGADRQNSLWVYVSGLRKALEPDRQKRTDGTILLTRAPGYVLQVDPGAVDAARFEYLVAEGRSLTDTDPAAASLVLGEALALWRGRAYEEFTYESFAQAEIARLEELRLEAVTARVDADLRRGLSRELVSELETLVRQHPDREELTGQLMLALSRSGRQTEALRTYARLRARLGEELGIEPGAALRRIEEQIITGTDTGPTSTSGGGATPVGSGLTIRGYELRDALGEGAYGIVYRAYQPAVGREVAIKVIRPELADDPDFIRRFETEAQVVASLEHPHIVPLYDYWREPGAAYLVMRLMRGGSLAEIIESSALGATEAARVAAQLGSALRTAHRSGIVHRDVRPENVLFDDDGNAYLADFGIAISEEDAWSDGGSGGDLPIRSVRAPYASPEQRRAEGVTASTDIYSMGVVLAQALAGIRGDVGQVEGALSRSVTDVIERATAPEVAQRHGSVDEFVAEFTEALGQEVPVEEVAEARTRIDNPYKGLRSFASVDASDFHGRERLVERLVARLGEPGRRGRFVAVVGPSGSGKSSVVRAGLLPALRAGALPRSDRWFTIEMTPAPHPYESLEEALRHVAVDPPGSLLEMLVGSERGLVQAARKVLPAGAQLVLVVDQFEELFTQVTPEISARFVDLLVHAVTDDLSPIRLVVTLRADFYDRPLRNRGMGELLRDGTQVVTPMTPEEAERAITGPLQPLGVAVEPGLVAELVSDIVDRPGALPLLQYTLTELFEARAGNRLTSISYEAMGGVSGALVTRAEALLAGLGEGAHDATRQVFLRLVTIGDGADDTRRRMLRSELDDLPVPGSQLQAVLDTFGRHRLLSFDRDPVTRGPTVEISHEALLTEWVRLRTWIDEARSDIGNQRRLAASMHEWRASGERSDYLLRGGPLEQLHGWATTTTVPLTADEQAYLDASVTERDRTAAEDLARERRAADAEERARRRARLLAGAGLACVLIAATAVFGLLQWRSATEAREENDSLVDAAELVTAAEAALIDDPELAVLYGTEAIRATAGLGFATEDAVDVVHWGLQGLGVEYPVGGDVEGVVRASPTGLTGVFPLEPAELVAHAEGAIARRLTRAECEDALGGACPSHVPLPGELPLRFGTDAYGIDLPDVLPNRKIFGPGPLAGTSLTIAIASPLAFFPGWEAELARFTEETGIEVTTLSNFDFDATFALASGGIDSYPDVVSFFGPTPEWARERAIDLGAFIDLDVLRSDFGDYLVDVMSFPGPDGEPDLLSIPANLGPKGLVFFAKGPFEEAGYEIPATWDELVTLSEQMVADGRTPWCFGWEGGPATGWPGSDLLESLVLRVGGTDAYDAWVRGDLPFSSPTVREAASLAEQLLFGEGFVRGGAEAISGQGWGTILTNLLDVNPLDGLVGPQCMMVTQAYVQASLLGPTTPFGPGGQLGVDIDAFALPPVEAGDPQLTTGSGALVAAMSDRPEVRALMRYIASPTFGEAWATIAASPPIPPAMVRAGATSPEADIFISANRRFDVGAYGSVGPDDERVRVVFHEQLRDAIEAGTFRYDMSDQTPTDFGAWTADLVPGPFWQGMVDWVGRTKPIEEILADLDAARAEIDARAVD